MKVTSKPKFWDWKAWEGGGIWSKSLGGRWACSSTQHQEITYILQWRKPVEALFASSREQPLPLCLDRKLKWLLTSHGHYAVLCAATQFCTAAMDTSLSKKDSPILGKLVRITSSLLVHKNFRVSKVSGMLRALSLQKIFAEEKARPTDLMMSPRYLNKSLLNISVIVFPFRIRFVPLFNSLFNSLQTLRWQCFCCLDSFWYHHIINWMGSILSNR